VRAEIVPLRHGHLGRSHCALMVNYLQYVERSMDDESSKTPSHLGDPYEAPCLRNLGNLLMLTLGGSSGVGDSGTSSTQDWPRPS
jgi:hypothetical protein